MKRLSGDAITEGLFTVHVVEAETGKYTVSVTIHNPRVGDEGGYKLVANNSKGPSELYLEIEVTSKLSHHAYVTLCRKRVCFAQDLECEFYISAGSVRRAPSCDASHLAMMYSNLLLVMRYIPGNFGLGIIIF